MFFHIQKQDYPIKYVPKELRTLLRITRSLARRLYICVWFLEDIEKVF